MGLLTVANWPPHLGSGWTGASNSTKMLQFPLGRTSSRVSTPKSAALDVRRADVAFPAADRENHRGSFRPVEKVCKRSVSEGVVVVEGEVPSSLRGLFIRNGPNPVRVRSGDEYHVWDGDGMLHAVWFGGDGNEAEIRYKNRFVETLGRRLESQLAPGSSEPLFDGLKFTGQGMAQTIALSMVKWSMPSWLLGLKQDENVPGDTDFMVMKKNVANTSTVFHHGKLFALWEAGLPYEIDVSSLDTIGPSSLGGSLTKSMSAHPKVDPKTNEMIDVTYDLLRVPHCEVHVWNKDGQLLHRAAVDSVADPIMIHDCAITENYTLVLDVPLGLAFSLDILDPSNVVQVRYNSDKPARVGLLPRFGCNRDIKWFTISSGIIFHTINAYEEDGKVVLHAIQHPGIGMNVVGAEAAVMESQPREFVFDISSGETSERAVRSSYLLYEMPVINPDLLGRKVQYAFSCAQTDAGQFFSCCEKLDLKNDDADNLTYNFPEGCSATDFVFTPKIETGHFPGTEVGNDRSDDGWLLSYVHNWVTDKSEVHVVDAETMQLQCRIALPGRVPGGLHSAFIPKHKLPADYSLV